MKMIRFTAAARINIGSIISGQPAGSIGSARIDFKLLDKISMSKEDLAAVNFQVYGLQGERPSATWDVAKAADFPLLAIDLEESEATRLMNLLTSWNRFRASDVQWTDGDDGIFPQLGIPT